MDEKDALLKEYEVCQHGLSSGVNSYWLGVGIFGAANIGLLGWLFFNVISSPDRIPECQY